MFAQNPVIPFRMTAKATENVCVMGIAATVASNEVRISFLCVQHILQFEIQHSHLFFLLWRYGYLSSKHQSKYWLPCSRIHQMEWMNAILLNSIDGRRNTCIRFSSASTIYMYGVIPFSVSPKAETLMTLALWLNRSKSSHHGFHSFFFCSWGGRYFFFHPMAINLSAFGSSILKLICVVHIGVTPYGHISGGGGLPYKKIPKFVFLIS